MKYPLNRPMTGDGMWCRVCGCTQQNACPEGCGWVQEPSYTFEVMGPLCTACAGTPNDLAFIARLVAKLLEAKPLRAITRKRLGLILLAAARRGEERASKERQD